MAGRRSTKLRTDHYPSVDVRCLAQQFQLDRYAVLEGGVRVSLEWRACYFGGARAYFQCPRCGGRACILYRFRFDSKCSPQFGCQKCLDMVHPVENEGKLERSVRRNHKAINRRNYDPSRPEGKPKWTRWPTWKRLSEQFVVDAMRYFENHEKIIMLLRRSRNSKLKKKN